MGRTGADVKTIFIGALDREPGADRVAYLDAACAGDQEMRRRVEALLRAHEQASDVLGPARDSTDEASTLAATSAPAPGSEPGSTLAADPRARADATSDSNPATGPVAVTIGDPVGPNGVGLARGSAVRYFGDYEIQGELGRGGMGVVYQARQVSLNRPVALKMLRAGMLAGDDELRRFQNEAEAVALLDHAGIVPVYEVGEHEGQRYLSMKLVRGGNLAERLAAYKDDPRAAAALVAEAAEAVYHAHMRGILHRDLKPANILVDAEGHPHVTDFGLAKRVHGDFELTLSGAILGTPGYMSSEQAAGRRGTITTATDVYGLGSVLYALLTGKAPFTGDSVVDTLHKVREQAPEPPHNYNAKLPRDLEVICLKCLEKDPRRRYSSAQALADDLRAWLGSRPIAARPVGTLTLARLWCHRRPAVAGLSAAVVVVALAGLAFGASQWSAALRNAQVAREKAALATANERLALANAREAQQRGDQLVATNRSLRHTTYASVMRLAQREWEQGNIGLARTRLDSLAPRPGESDLRGFDWSFLKRQFDACLLSLPFPGVSSVIDGRSVSFSSDGRRLIATSRELLVIFDTTTGRETLRIPGGPFLDATFSPCGRYLATLSLEAEGHVAPQERRTGRVTLTIRDAVTSEPLRRLVAREGFDGHANFSPDGRFLALKIASERPTEWRSTLALIDVATGTEVRFLYDGRGVAKRAAFSPDGRFLVSETDYATITIWDKATGETTRTIRDATAHMIRAVAFSPDGRRLASIGDDGTAKVWELATGRNTQTLRVDNQDGSDLGYSPDGLHLVTTTGRDIARLWDAETGEYLFQVRGVGRGIAYSPDGFQLAAFGGRDTVRLWDATGEALSEVLGPFGGDVIYHLAVSPDGELLATGDGSLWDARTLARRYRVQAGAITWSSAAFSPDGALLVLAGGRLATPIEGGPRTWGTVRVVEAASGRERLAIQDPRGFVSSAVVSQDGRWIATTTAHPADYTKGWATLRDARTGRTHRDLGGFEITARSVAFRPDARAVVYGAKNALLVRGVEDGAELLTIGGFEGVPRSAVFSPDGRRVAAILSGPDGSSTVRIWDAGSGRAELTLSGTERDSVVKVIFSPDGRRLATGDFMAQVRLWDVASGEELLTLKGHTSWVWALAFSPDGSRLYSGGRDQTVRVWETAPPTPPRAAPAPPDADGVRRQAIALERRERHGEAERLWRRFLEIARQRRLDDDPQTYDAESRLGACLTRLGRYEDAEGYLLRSYRAMRADIRHLTPAVHADFRTRVDALYKSWGRTDRAAAWRAEELDAAFPADPFAR